MKQKTEIEIEVSETIAYSKRDEKREVYCPKCRSFADMASPRVAAILAHSTEREVYRLVETDKVHFIESGGVLICLNSLLNPTLLNP